MNREQNEYYKKIQQKHYLEGLLKYIRKQLGDSDDKTVLVTKFQDRIKKLTVSLHTVLHCYSALTLSLCFLCSLSLCPLPHIPLLPYS